VKNLLSGVFRYAAQQGYFDTANPVKLAEIPAFAASGKETKPYALEEIAAMLQLGGVVEWRELSPDACSCGCQLDEVTLKFVSRKSAEEKKRTKEQSNGVPENLRCKTAFHDRGD
jgi:hypothetical protein